MKVAQPIKNFEKVLELLAILKKYSERDYIFGVLALNTGLRVQDLLDLRVSDVQGKEYIDLIEKKTRKLQRILILAHIRPIIQAYTQGKEPACYLFTQSHSTHINRPISRIAIHKMLEKARKELQLDQLSSHTLRKTFGFNFYQQYKDIISLQKIFNHSSPIITIRYIGIEKDLIDTMLINMNNKFIL